MRVMVLGCGPAGLFAAHAARSLGADVEVYSRRRKSEMHGPQYLHSDIPGLTDGDPGFSVTWRLYGSLLGYLHRVYGETLPDEYDGPRMAESDILGVHPAWDIRRAYDRAWRLYAEEVVHTYPISPNWLQDHIRRAGWPDVVISTIPLHALCAKRAQHLFAAQEIWAIGDAPERGIFAPRIAADNEILFNGTDEYGWARVSNVAGYHAMEWPADPRPPLDGVARVVKPLRTNCDCLVDVFGSRLIRVGRYGAWNRLNYTHMAYWTVLDRLKAL